MKHYMKYVITLATLMTSSPVLAVGLVDKCLVGKWVPDMTTVSRQLNKLSFNAPKSQISGSVVMIIKARQPSEFRVKDWSFTRLFTSKPKEELLVSGKAKFTVSAPQGGEFHFAEKSNTYKQQAIIHYDGYTVDVDTDPIRQMLPMGEWAHGTYKCGAKTLVFTVSDQDSDGKLFTVWHRK